MIGGGYWIGGRNYLLNLIRVIDEWSNGELEPMLFVGPETEPAVLEDFRDISSLRVIESPVFTVRQNAGVKLDDLKMIVSMILFGKARSTQRVFTEYRVDVAFEHGRYYGRNFRIPTISWLPDFQHRHLRHLFTHWQYLRRDLCFRLQTSGTRKVMVSSRVALEDCVKMYPKSKSLVHSVPFAVPYVGTLDNTLLDEVASKYKLSLIHI